MEVKVVYFQEIIQGQMRWSWESEWFQIGFLLAMVYQLLVF